MASSTRKGQPQVSVILTSFNAELYVMATVESVLSQTMPDWELIVVDDGSTDGTVRNIVDRTSGESRVRVKIMAANTGGPAGPRNVGVGMACGRMVAFLDADDIWHPRKLEQQMEGLRSSGARVISTRRRSFRRNEEVRFEDDDVLKMGHAGVRVTHGRLTLKNWLCTSSVMGEANLFKRHPFPEDLKYKAVEDYWCWLKVHEEAGWSWLMRAPLVYYRLAETSISRSRWNMIRRHWILYGDYFGKSIVGTGRRYRSMATYAFFSLWRLFLEKAFKVR